MRSFYAMIIRTNEIDELIKDLFPRFRDKCLDI